MTASALVHFGKQSIALDTLRARGARAARALADRGATAGDVFAILMRNEPRFIEALTCIRCLNARRVLIPWHLTAAEVQPILFALKPGVLIVHSDLLPLLASALSDLATTTVVTLGTPAEIAQHFPVVTPSPPPSGLKVLRWESLIEEALDPLPIPARSLEAISLTSGSTGHPKIIRWSGLPQWVQRADGRTADRPIIHTSIVTAPLYHGGQYGVFSHACLRDAHQIILPKFDAESFLQAVERYRVNHAYMVPTMFVRLLKLPRVVRERYDMSSLNYILHTGGACPADIKRQMIDWLGPVIWEAYGCSEMSVIAACSSAEWLHRPGTVGRPLLPVRIHDSVGTPCPAGQPGEVLVDVSSLPGIFYDDGESRQQTIDGKRWLTPGDSGWLDADGFLYIAGRSDDLINTSRVKVYPLEIENALLMHPAIRDCAVFAIHSPEFGQTIGAAIQTDHSNPGIEADLRAFLGSQISEHKIPTAFIRVTRDIRNGAGKMNREQLAMDLGCNSPSTNVLNDRLAH